MSDTRSDVTREPELPPPSELSEMRLLLELARAFFPDILKSVWSGGRMPERKPSKESIETQVLRARAKYQTLIEQIPAVTFIASSSLEDNGNEIYVSPQIKSLLGYTAEEWLDTPLLWYQRLHPEDKKRLSKDFARTISRGEPLKGDYRFIAKDGHTVWVHGEVKIVHDELGRPCFIHGIGYDVSELKRAEEMQREAKHAEEEAKRAAEATIHAKDEFLAMLSHELRTPLTPILGGLDTLLESAPEEARAVLEMMRRNLQLETRLINDLLDLTRIGKGKLSIELKPVDAHEVIRQARESCAANLAHLEQKLALDAADCVVNADPVRLGQVIRNLLENAGRFTPAGGTVEVRTSNPAPSTLQILCQDNGAGIEFENLGRIFRAFEQCERSVRSGYGGLGLGLAISKALVEAHGGTIRALSAGRGRGAAFEIHLKTIPAGAVSQGAQTPGPTVAHHPDSGAKASPLRILLVEDHRDTRQVLARLLTRFGYQVDTANDARTGRERAWSAKFDLVISDIGLPDGSGLDLVQAIHARQAVPAIALSGYGAESDRQQSRRAGYSEHLVKPVESARLRETIERLTAEQPVA